MQINKEPEYEVVKTELIKTQKEWAPHFNNKGEKMISAPDIYRVAKAENKGLIESLAKDFQKRREITSSQIDYEKEEITHDAGSTVVKPKTIKIKIPHYDWEEARHDKETEEYLQALFDTKDNIDEILRVMKRYDPKRRLYLWTPTQSQRAERPVRSVGLCFLVLDRFDVDGDWFDYYDGFSRGVVVESAEQTAKKKSGAK